MVTILERDQVLIVGRHGIDAMTAPRRTLPCETTITGDGIYQIPDARRDPEFAPNGIPLGNARFRFYAGAPVLTPDSVRGRLAGGTGPLGAQADADCSLSRSSRWRTW